MTKKIVAVFLAAIMTVSMLAGCGSGNKNASSGKGDENTLTV